MRRCHIVGTFYPRPEKPKRGNFRFVVSTLLRRILGARSAHSNPTNGSHANAPATGREDGQHLQVHGFHPVPVGPVGAFRQPHLVHLLTNSRPVQVPESGQLGEHRPPSIAPLQFGQGRINLCRRVVKPGTGEQDSGSRGSTTRGSTFPFHDRAHLTAEAGVQSKPCALVPPMLQQVGNQAKAFALIQQISHFDAMRGQPHREEELHFLIIAHLSPLQSITLHTFSQPDTNPTQVKPSKIKASKTSV